MSKITPHWNALPCDKVDFSSLRRFRNSLTAKVLVRYCSLEFYIYNFIHHQTMMANSEKTNQIKSNQIKSGLFQATWPIKVMK